MQPLVLPRSSHTISRQRIDPDALKVLYRLHHSGYTAYLVGGGVRDLLLDRQPKDFDISTSARPPDVKKLFRNCRLIGRRFRLAHILYAGGKVIEVSTFRRQAEDNGQGEDLLVRRDNVFGTAEEDAVRRDFTINALFYDISSFAVIDHVGGLKDLETRTIRAIGDPAIRFREDPIRMLRAVKFATRLGFEIAAEDLAAIHRFRADLLKVPPERLNLEVGRLLGGGHAAASFGLLETTGVLDVIAPEISAFLARARAGDARAQEDHFWGDLAGLDMVVARAKEKGRELPQAVLIGGLVLAAHESGLDLNIETAEDSVDSGGAEAGAEAGTPEAATRTTDLLPLLRRLAVPRREFERLVHILRLAPRLLQPPSRQQLARSFARRHPELAEALTVLEARVAGGGEGDDELRAWHTCLPELADTDLMAANRGRGRPPAQRSALAVVEPEAIPAASSLDRDASAPRRRRRRGGRRRRGRDGGVADAPPGRGST